VGAAKQGVFVSFGGRGLLVMVRAGDPAGRGIGRKPDWAVLGEERLDKSDHDIFLCGSVRRFRSLACCRRFCVLVGPANANKTRYNHTQFGNAYEESLSWKGLKKGRKTSCFQGEFAADRGKKTEGKNRGRETGHHKRGKWHCGDVAIPLPHDTASGHRGPKSISGEAMKQVAGAFGDRSNWVVSRENPNPGPRRNSDF